MVTEYTVLVCGLIYDRIIHQNILIAKELRFSEIQAELINLPIFCLISLICPFSLIYVKIINPLKILKFIFSNFISF